jgi:hypothetical protein
LHFKIKKCEFTNSNIGVVRLMNSLFAVRL